MKNQKLLSRLAVSLIPQTETFLYFFHLIQPVKICFCILESIFVYCKTVFEIWKEGVKFNLRQPRRF